MLLWEINFIQNKENEEDTEKPLKKFACTILKKYSKLKCKEKFETLQHLESHIDVVHLKEKFHCDFCDLSFSLKASLEIHVNKVHLKKEPLKCEYCDS